MFAGWGVSYQGKFGIIITVLKMKYTKDIRRKKQVKEVPSQILY